MKFNKQSPLHVVLFSLILIFQFSCSKDSDLLTDYVLADSLDSKGIVNLVVDDTYQVSLSGSMVLDVLANDTFENEAEVVITETSTPNNGTVAINNDETLTYTPNAEIIEQVSDTTNTAVGEVVDTFTYTVEVVNAEGTTTPEEASVVIVAEVNADRPDAVSNISPFDYCQDGNPIGGGSGYDAILTTGTHIVSTNLTASAFRTLVEARKSGDVVFINSDVTIDLTALGTGIIHVAGGVTIASDRGNGVSTGALIKTDEVMYQGTGSERQVFETTGTGVRFTGFRFQGPFGGKGTWSMDDYDLRRKFGIVSAYDDTEVDNMELYNWPFAAVSLSPYGAGGFYGSPNQPSVGHLYHHNYAHNNRQNRFGYAVNLQYAEAKIYGNIFENNRHDIAGGGDALLNSYEAYCNTIREGGTHHNFDMHADDGHLTIDSKAGYFIHIHHNDFEDLGAIRQTTNKENIRISGIPTTSVIVEYNRFVHPGFYIAFKQMNVTNSPQNVVEGNNRYNGD